MPMPEAMPGKAQGTRCPPLYGFNPPLYERTIDPALPRIGTDFMTLRVVMRIVYPHNPLPQSESLPHIKRQAEADVETLSEKQEVVGLLHRSH
jgi:hypothetical protein